MTTLSATEITAGTLEADDVTVREGLYPGSSTFPGPSAFPGRGSNLAASAASTMTLTASAA